MVSKQKSVTFAAVGDVILARKNYMASLTRVRNILREADVAFFNSETPYATQGSPGMGQHGAPAHDPMVMPALVDAGFDVCTVANNHTLDWGIDAVVECRERYEKMGIAVCGIGSNMTEARKPAIVEKKGVKFAFLGYCSTGPEGIMAEEDKPGCAVVRAHTVYEPYEYQPGSPPSITTFCFRQDLKNMVEDIKKAKEQADIVVMTNHWGIHHLPIVIPEYEYDCAYAAIDAGADLVLGTHPHILKAVEVYKGKAIFHSLSNFAMENRLAKMEGVIRSFGMKSWSWREKMATGPRSPDDKKTIIVKCVINGKKLERVSYLPVMLDEYDANPEPITRSDPRAEGVFKYVDEISRAAGHNTKFSWDGDEVVVHT